MAGIAAGNFRALPSIRTSNQGSRLGISESAGPRGLAILILFISGLVDLPRAIQLGPVTSQAILTIAYFIAGIPLFVLIPVRGRRIPVSLWPLIVFWSWAVISLSWSSAQFRGIQNVLVFGTTLVLALTSSVVASTDLSFAFWLQKNVWRSVLLAVIPYSATIIWFGAGANDLFSARNFGLYALFGVVYQLSRWHYGARSGLVWAVGITILIGLSQSRLALGVAVTLFPLSQLPTQRPIRMLKMLFVLVVVLATSYAALSYSDTLRERFFSGDVSVKLGPVTINGSGRNAFWQATIQSFWDAPILGQGAGSAEGLIDSIWPNIQHPHSDYLRIAHDYGFVGFVVWLAGIATLLVTLRRNWCAAEKMGAKFAQIQLGAFLALISYVLQMSMENAFVYLYISAPLGLIVGSALGIHRATIARGQQSS